VGIATGAEGVELAGEWTVALTGAGWEAEDAIEIDIEVRLGASKAFCFDFHRVDAKVSFEAFGLPFDIEGRFTAKTGLDRLDVQAIVSLLSFLPFLTIESEASLPLTGRTLSCEPKPDAMAAWEGASASLELHGEIKGDEPVLDELVATGIEFDATWDDASREVRTSFDPG